MIRVETYENGVLVDVRNEDEPPAPELDPQAQRIADLEATVTALTEQATGKITKAQLTARLDAAKGEPVKPGKG